MKVKTTPIAHRCNQYLASFKPHPQTYLPPNQLVFSVVYQVTQCCLVTRMRDNQSCNLTSTCYPPICLLSLTQRDNHAPMSTLVQAVLNTAKLQRDYLGVTANLSASQGSRSSCNKSSRGISDCLRIR
jgi:hypothetical protein